MFYKEGFIMNKVVHMVLGNPPIHVLADGKLIKENSKFVYIEFNSKTYVYVKAEENQNIIVYREVNCDGRI
jgi:hypothetical protein